MPKPLFQCDICGRVWHLEKDAIDCEKTHHTQPDGVEYVFDKDDNSNKYPTKIKLWFNGGKLCCEYYRKKV